MLLPLKQMYCLHSSFLFLCRMGAILLPDSLQFLLPVHFLVTWLTSAHRRISCCTELLRSPRACGRPPPSRSPRWPAHPAATGCSCLTRWLRTVSTYRQTGLRQKTEHWTLRNGTHGTHVYLDFTRTIAARLFFCGIFRQQKRCGCDPLAPPAGR